jgi:serine/threonine-protein kinase
MTEPMRSLKSTDDPRISDLLLQWEEGEQSGQPVSAEVLCSNCPELLPALRARIAALEQLRPVLDLEEFAEAVPPHTQKTGDDTVETPEFGDQFWTRVQRPAAATQPLPAPPGYELLGEIDRGGMAVIYKARQVKLDRLVALKVIAAGPNARPTDRARFQTEARAVGRLSHPNIVEIHDVGEIDGYPYLVLEYLEGGDLETALTGRLLSPREAAQILEPLARAAHHAHHHGVIHRDIKPGNVLLTHYRRLPGNQVDLGTPKLADFGLARCLGDAVGLTRTGVIVGTPAYMAPEQVLGNKALIGPATDVHGLGALLYRMLTGMPPFLGDDSLSVGEQVLHHLPPPPSRLNPEVPADLDAICLRCLQKEPADRFSTAAELADALTRFLAGQPLPARTGTSQRQRPRWLWLVIGLTLGAAVALAAAHFLRI